MASSKMSSEGKIPYMSEPVFVGLCEILGTPHEVAMRRDILEVLNIVHNPSEDNNDLIFSGSYKEGFRLIKSDMDFMTWPNNYRVIWDLTQNHFYNVNTCSAILADSSDSPPGFTLLWLPTSSATMCVLASCFRMNERFYISSSLYRENKGSLEIPNSTKHGPCSFIIMDGTECDCAPCFFSEIWPPSASSWIIRCHSWPNLSIVKDIVKKGCHFVAIAHELGNHVDNEWRISFSLAEQQLVYSMNHCQFLTYGLLKIFLNEVINHGYSKEGKLLCSYHIKTALFWVIQQNRTQQWCPQNLLECFWVCFKLILKWVYEGVCPNFFIPENNMFLTKIYGNSQANLFRRLITLYEKGMSCLLQSASVRSYIIKVIPDPRLSIRINTNLLISEAEFDVELFLELQKHALLTVRDLYTFKRVSHQIEQTIIDFPLTKYQVAMLQIYTSVIFQGTAFLMYGKLSENYKNKSIYIYERMSRYMLYLATKFGCVSDMLYVAMCYYREGRYQKALSVIKKTKCKLTQPYVIYMHGVDAEMYSEVFGGRPLSTKMRNGVANNITIGNKIVYITEIVPEQVSALHSGESFLLIPPLILSHMLEFLSLRHVSPLCAHKALNDLQTLVEYDQGKHIPPLFRDISWQILGICLQIKGDNQAALYAFQQSLKQEPYHKIQTATLMRIRGILK